MSTAVPKFDLKQLTEPAAGIENYLSDYLDQRELPENLRDAAKYALLGGGKRMRPILVVRCCEAVGGKREMASPPAAAIELIHCFSLVHDDLPAMDDDDLRRGRPTLHIATNEAMAILAGDLLNTMAFELITTKVADPKLACQLVRELAVSTNDMIAGQVYDTIPCFPEGLTDLQELQLIHHNKTGALLRCACRMGAIVGGADEKQLAAITDYASAIGLMFQVVDDLLDITQTTEQLGKTAGKDLVQGKLTYPSLIGIEATRQQIIDLQEQAHAALDLLKAPNNALRDLCDFMATRSN
jgi:geranylgeranyl diphosphate synthase type II